MKSRFPFIIPEELVGAWAGWGAGTLVPQGALTPFILVIVSWCFLPASGFIIRRSQRWNHATATRIASISRLFVRKQVLNIMFSTLAGVAQWIEWRPANQRISSSIPNSQSGHMPMLWARSPVGGVWEATTHWCFSPSFSLPSPL